MPLEMMGLILNSLGWNYHIKKDSLDLLNNITGMQ